MRPISFVVLAALLAGACREPTRVPQPARIDLAPGALTFDAISQARTVTAVVYDANGVELPEARVEWRGSPVVMVTPRPDAPNSARIEATASGTGVVTASVGQATGAIGVTVTQVPEVLQLRLGVSAARVGSVVPAPLRIEVYDALGHPAKDVVVTLDVLHGGSIAPAAVTTGADGAAHAQWTLGTVAGFQRVHARAGSLMNSASITALPGPAVALRKHAGDAQPAWTDAPLDVAPAVRVVDAHENGVADVDVAFTPSSGTVTATTARTGVDGVASAGAWTLGSLPGTSTLTATAGALGGITFTVDARVGEPLVAIQPVAGDAQLGVEGMALAMAPAVRLVDTAGAPQANRRVTFRVAQGNGAVSQAVATTGSDGIATTDWILGGVAGPNVLTAHVDDGPARNNGMTFRATGCTGSPGAYSINICFATPMSASQRAAFIDAAARWSAIVTADLPDLEVDLPAPRCGGPLPPIASRIDDLVIFASVQPIDGRGNVLGSAGWCYARDGGLPLIGTMRFDAEDVAAMQSAGRFGAVILHEIGHVLGIGTVWSTSGLLRNPSAPGGPPLDTHFDGANAIFGFDQIGGAAYTGGAKVPVENAAGPGSINSHWRENVLGNELMTPVINAGTNPLTVLSVLSLRDIGYQVDPARADSPLLSDIMADRRAAPVFQLVDDVDTGPRYVIDRQGRVRRIR